MISERAIKDRAMQIDPCAFKSYSGSSRHDAQQEALARARRELEWEPREQRRYTLDEIDRMRKAISRVQPFHGAYRPPGPMSVTIEDQLRTAMIGGVDPKELEDKADAHWERIRERREARRREQELASALARWHRQPVNVMAEAEAVVADAPLNSFWRGVITSRIAAIFSRFGMGRGS